MLGVRFCTKRLFPVRPDDLFKQLDQAEEPILIALSQAVRQDLSLRDLLATLETRDPRQVRTGTVLSLFEQQQERLPPLLMGDTVLSYDDLPWAASFSVQAQLKRVADLLVAALLLLVTSPFVLLAALLIWLEDRGPVLYAQQRSGWLEGHLLSTNYVRCRFSLLDAPVVGLCQAIDALQLRAGYVECAHEHPVV